ncbi:MAG: TrkA family potassium uptake protein [Actinomycetota bacterium]
MHIVVAGCGRVGSGLAITLAEQGHSVAVIDRNAKAFKRLGVGFSGSTVIGSSFDRMVLQSAGIRDADGLAAVSNGDNTNILTARIARENYGVKNVVARIYDPRRAMIYKKLGIPTVATVTWTVDQVERWLSPERTTELWNDSSGKLMLIERILPSSWAGASLKTLEELSGARLVAVTRAGVARLDGHALIGQDGDVLTLAVLREQGERLEQTLESAP